MRRAARLLLVTVVLGTLPGGQATPAGRQELPNVLVIVTDDQRGGLAAMPKTKRWFVDGGTRFSEAFATTPLCCPSRASIFTGQYAHNHGVKENPEAENLEQTSTIQSYLKAAGYRTAIAGKYLNKWDLSVPPPFFDRWAIMNFGYYGTEFDVDGVRQVVPEYSTTFIRDYALDRIWEFEVTDDVQPWFLYVAPMAPHGPWTAEPKYEDAEVPPWKGNPAVRERDRSDKPRYVRTATATLEEGRTVHTGQFRTLMSVDDLAHELFQTLGEAGELENTLAFYVSDNGFLSAEHGLLGKLTPYRQSVSVELFMRWPQRVPAGTVSDRLVANIDIAPTIMDATGLVVAREPMDGRSLLEGPGRDRILLEAWAGPVIKRWASLRTDTYTYVEHYRLDEPGVIFREYYAADDRWELRNLFGDSNPANDPAGKPLHRQLRADRRCAGTEGRNACP